MVGSIWLIIYMAQGRRMRSNIMVSERNKIKNQMTNCYHETSCTYVYVCVCLCVCRNKRKRKQLPLRDKSIVQLLSIRDEIYYFITCTQLFLSIYIFIFRMDEHSLPIQSSYVPTLDRRLLVVRRGVCEKKTIHKTIYFLIA